MGAEIYTLNKIPDLTLASYSAEEGGGVDSVIRQHATFYRQLNRKGLLFDETYHLIYLYNPNMKPGQRLKVLFRADHKDQPECMQEFMTASPLSSYFQFEQCVGEPKAKFVYSATLAKQDGFVASSFVDKNVSYYTVNPWKPNEKARLMGLFRMLQKLQYPAAYVVSMKAVDLSETMRESFRSQIQFIRNTQKLNSGNRDENAEQCLRIYEKFFESLRANPHFLCRISAYAQSESVAKLILDSAASEAVEEGSYRIVCEQGRFNPCEPPVIMEELCTQDAPRGMRRWNSLFLLKELTPFVVFPTLYPGEAIEIPKETSPILAAERKDQKGNDLPQIRLGLDKNGYDVNYSLDIMNKHALIAGVPGSGKTNTMLHISSQIAGGEHKIPILVLEPAKKEYRALARNGGLPNLVVFSPGGTGAFPLRINPFEFSRGIKLSEHITNLIKVFEGAFDLTPPMPFLISEGIEQVYRDHGWYPFEENKGQHTYPSVRELYDKVAELLDRSAYAPEVKSNLKSCLQVRIGSLISREMGNVFDVPSSTLTPEEWLKATCVIELESLGADAANFLTLLLLTTIREVLRKYPDAPKDKPRHVIFLEEAHNLIGPTTVANAENGDAKVASTKYIVDMLAEVRALQESIIIADQLPTALAPQVVKNTSLKLGHRITAMDDRQLLASTMSADGVQLERMGTYEPGQVLCMYENIQKPFEMKILAYEGKDDAPTNSELYKILSKRAVYQNLMNRDFDIIFEKYAKREKRLSVEISNISEEYLELMALKEEESYKKYEARYLKRVEKLFDDYLEYIMELVNYCSVNPLFFKQTTEHVAKRVRTLKEYLKLMIGRTYPEEYQRLNSMIDERVKSGCVWLS